MIEFETKTNSRYQFDGKRGCFIKSAGIYRGFPGDKAWRPYVSIHGKIQAGERVIICLPDGMAILTTPIRRVLNRGTLVTQGQTLALPEVQSFGAWLLDQGDCLSLGG